MKFCEKCNNMYYMKNVSEDVTDQIMYYCRNCGYEDSNISNKNLKVFKYEKDVNIKNSVTNEYTKYDPTLPHVTHIKCPNQECASNQTQNSVDNDIITLRYDDKNMRYMYLCCNCDFTWKS